MWGRMSENIRGGKKIKEGEKGDGKCYCRCKNCCTRCPERVLIEIAKKHCRKYGHVDGGSNEYRPMYIYKCVCVCVSLSVLILIVFSNFYIVLYMH
jgi:hypothetical protein